MNFIKTNIWTEDQLAPLGVEDAIDDFYEVTDAKQDHVYLQSKIIQAIIAISLTPSVTYAILYGGEVTDGGGGTIDIAKGVGIGKDDTGELYIFGIPALTGITLPAGWNDNRQIWVRGRYTVKTAGVQRLHYNGNNYYYQVEDSYEGEASSDDLFVDVDPAGAELVWGSFQMTGAGVFTSLDAGERTDKLIIGFDPFGDLIIQKILPMIKLLATDSGIAMQYFQNSTTGSATSDGLKIGIDASENAVIENQESTNMTVKTGAEQHIDGATSVNLDIAGSNGLKIYSDLIHEMPSSSRVHACFSNGTFQVLSGGGSWEVIIFPTEYYDTKNEYNTGNGRFTATRNGYYLFTAGLYTSDDDATLLQNFALFVDGVQSGVKWSPKLHASYQTAGWVLAGVINLTAGSYLELRFNDNNAGSGGAITIYGGPNAISNNLSYMTITKIQ